MEKKSYEIKNYLKKSYLKKSVQASVQATSAADFTAYKRPYKATPQRNCLWGIGKSSKSRLRAKIQA